MGADSFYNRVKKQEGQTAGQAFDAERSEAQYEHGHGGYTGTIAEKDGISISRKPECIDADDWINELDDFDEDDKDNEHYSELKRDFEIYDDKWGNALCIVEEEHFIFCGHASS